MHIHAELKVVEAKPGKAMMKKQAAFATIRLDATVCPVQMQSRHDRHVC